VISHQYGCIFIHIPKTGGKSVQRFFRTNWQNHKDISRYAQELDPRIFKSYYKFTVVRNPWDRIVSDYNYQKKKRSQADHRLFIHDERGNHRSFNKWLEAVLSDLFGCDPAQWGRTLAKESTDGVPKWIG
jgi:sulfotransferase famil protein